MLGPRSQSPMIRSIFATVFFMAPLILGFSEDNHVSISKCGSHISEDALIATEKHFIANAVSREAFEKLTPNAANTTIPVYFHVINTDSTLEGGNISDCQIQNQISMLNGDYSKTGLTFYLANTTHTLNPEWFRGAKPGSALQHDMKQQLRQGDANALNIYTVSLDRTENTDGIIFGYGTFPANYASNPTDDGVVIHHNILPGGGDTVNGNNKMLTHEIGHWVGLYHTFQGGCDGSGDQVDDTPAEGIPATGCPAERDSCPNDPGEDPVHNFMDLTDDECMSEFTPGQITRMADQLRTYRGISM